MCGGVWARPAGTRKHGLEIRPRDAVAITVFQEPDLSVSARIAADGTINYPMLGAVAIGGLNVLPGDVVTVGESMF